VRQWVLAVPKRLRYFLQRDTALQGTVLRIFLSVVERCLRGLQHDEDIGFLLDQLRELGLDRNTIVIYSSDNGVEHSTWPHGGTTPYRGEKMTTWEGGVRVPMLVRWPGRIPAGTKLNGIQSHEDVFTTLASAAGIPDIRQRLSNGDALGTDTIKKAYIDGLDNLTYWTGKSDESARNMVFMYEEGKLAAVRMNQWKAYFSTRDGYYGTSTEMALPMLVNLRQDPFESYLQAPGPRAELTQHKTYMMNMVLEQLAQHVATFKSFPPRQPPTTTSVSVIMQRMKAAT
jgi:arylsulfatase